MRRWWPTGLLVLVAVLGWLAVALAPSQAAGTELWPVGLASAAVLVSRSRTWASLAVLTPLVVLGYLLGGRPAMTALIAAAVIVAEVAVVWLVLTTAGRHRARLGSLGDLLRYAAAAVLGAGTASVVTALAAAAFGYDSPGPAALTVGLTHLTGQLVVLPFFCQPLIERSTAPRWEQSLAWASLLGVTSLVFVLDDLPALGFLVMPLLVWGALRLGTWQALAQVAAVAVPGQVFYVLGLGPVTWVPDWVVRTAAAAALHLQLFVVGCALVVVPLTLLVALRRGAERDAATERDTLARLVQAARGVAIVGADPRGRITVFNPGAQRLLGYQPEEVLGRSAEQLVTAEAVRTKAEQLGLEPDFLTLARRLLEPDQDGTLLRLRRRDGDERDHRVTLTELVDGRGRVTGYLSTSQDVTEQVRTRETLERALQRLREVDALKDGFISTLTHELRTPVTSILGWLEILDDEHVGELQPGQRDAVERVQNNANRLLALIDDLLTLSRMQEVGGFAVRPEQVTLNGIVHAGCAVVRPQAQRAGVAMSCRVPEDDLVAHGDRVALEGVLINLVGNAVKFTPAGGEIVIGLDRDEQEATITVSDTGIGIAEDEVALLFTRFYRSSAALDRAIPGSGLGLSIARGVVRAHGGDITVASRPGVGTTFSVRLPLAQPG